MAKSRKQLPGEMEPYKREFLNAISAKLGRRAGGKFHFSDGRTATLFRFGKIAMIGIHEMKEKVETTEQYALMQDGSIEYVVFDTPLVKGKSRRGEESIEDLVGAKKGQKKAGAAVVAEDELRAITEQIASLEGPVKE